MSLTIPDGWTHDDTDQWGCVLKPSSAGYNKIRIHNSHHKAPGPLEASRLANENTNKGRTENDFRFQPIVDEKGVVTVSCIIGYRSTIGKPAYLHRYYFQRPDQSFFCVCVYFNGDMAFAEACEKMILQTLRLTNEKG